MIFFEEKNQCDIEKIIPLQIEGDFYKLNI